VDVLVEIEDENLLRLILVAKKNKRSLNQELLEILNRAAKIEQRRKRKAKKR
jgi:hypothetical protein